ncbi:hypothetical protein ABVK25_011252 [Lepraria finkii]|uniref:Uncharacterized protein n=1 Tax=Lepraria finkii TaxID=1340010 RepID=A0ABR4AQT1_9LECA
MSSSNLTRNSQGSSGNTSNDRGNKYLNPPAIERYIAEEDAWKQFLVLGTDDNDDRRQAIAQDSKKWDETLTRIPPRKTQTQAQKGSKI